MWAPMHAVPFGVAFDCTRGSHTSVSIIDLTHTDWSIDTSALHWYNTGLGNDAKSVDTSNPKYITIEATGNCGVTSTIASPTSSQNAWNRHAAVILKKTRNIASFLHVQCHLHV
jgi:hypothetical protein